MLATLDAVLAVPFIVALMLKAYGPRQAFYIWRNGPRVWELYNAYYGGTVRYWI